MKRIDHRTMCREGRAVWMKHHAYNVVNELRESTRFAKEPGAFSAVIVRDKEEMILAEVHDESLGGLGLIIADNCEFQLDEEVNILFSSNYMHARVRHIRGLEDGRYLVGFQCEPAKRSAPLLEDLGQHL